MKIVISGTTGVGKSTTVNLLKDILENQHNKKVVLFDELVVNSPFIDLFFKSLTDWSFLAQLDFLMVRFNQYIESLNIPEDKNTIIIFDRSFLEDLIFINLEKIKLERSQMQTNIILTLYNILVDSVEGNQFDYFLQLKASFDTIEERLKMRGRKIEELVNRTYWQDLYYKYYSKKEYEEIFRKNSKKLVKISTDYKKPSQVVDRIISIIL